MSDTEIVRRVFFSLVSAFCIVNIASHIVGAKNKAKWFKKRKATFFLNRRSILGEQWHFGRPVTKEGCGVTAALLAAVALSTYIIFSL